MPQIAQPQFDIDSTVEALLVIGKHLEGIGKTPDRFNLGHLLYLADRTHLERWGSMISNDRHHAFDHGSAPSRVLGALETLAGAETMFRPSQEFLRRMQSAFALREMSPFPTFSTLRAPNPGCLGRYEIETLEEVLRTYAHLDFNGLSDAAHDPAHKQVYSRTPDGAIPIEVLARTLKDGDLLVEHLANPFGD